MTGACRRTGHPGTRDNLVRRWFSVPSRQTRPSPERLTIAAAARRHATFAPG